MQYRIFTFIIPLSLLLSSCAPLPKIIVLHDPLSAEEHLSLGLSYEMKGEYDHALSEYLRAAKKDKRDYRPLFYAGNVHYKKGEYEGAKSRYRKALKLSPGNGDIHNNLAWAYLDAGEFEKAKIEIEKGLAIRRDPFYLDTLAHIYGKMGKNEEALKALQDAVGLTPPEEIDLLINEYQLLGDLYEKLGKDDEARAARERAKEYSRGK